MTVSGMSVFMVTASLAAAPAPLSRRTLTQTQPSLFEGTKMGLPSTGARVTRLQRAGVLVWAWRREARPWPRHGNSQPSLRRLDSASLPGPTRSGHLPVYGALRSDLIDPPSPSTKVDLSRREHDSKPVCTRRLE